MSRKHVYIAFDADNDMNYYRLLQAWHNNENLPFEFYNAHDLFMMPRGSNNEDYIKSKLRERLDKSKLIIVLIGSNTRYLHKFVRWELEYGIKNSLPIIAVNLNGKRTLDHERCPAIIREELVVYISFNMKIIDYAIKDWPSKFNNLKIYQQKKSEYYSNTIYNSLGIK